MLNLDGNPEVKKVIAYGVAVVVGIVTIVIMEWSAKREHPPAPVKIEQRR
jgi:hypothetical protein